jgi:NAD+ synthase (glutamine-hydrolysing)
MLDPDDNRHDLRPFLYVVGFAHQFQKIRAHAESLEAKMAGGAA